jgi:hypothetical protein
LISPSSPEAGEDASRADKGNGIISDEALLGRDRKDEEAEEAADEADSGAADDEEDAEDDGADDTSDNGADEYVEDDDVDGALRCIKCGCEPTGPK